MLRRPRIAPLLAAVIVGAVAVAAVAAPSAAPQVPDPYFPADGNVGYDVLHYDIHDEYQFTDGHLSGETTIRLVPSQKLTTFNVDLLLDVDAVTVDGEDAGFAKPDKHEVVITPSQPLSKGAPVDVTVTYQGVPGDLSWRGESNWLADAEEVVTMNEPHMAAWWFPSNDHPTDKATFDITVTTDAAKDVISNGVLVDRTVDDGQATTHWRMSDPMTTYLAFFAAGDFVIEEGRVRGFDYYNAVSEQLGPNQRTASLKTLRKSARITAWLQDELGDYPFDTTGGLVTSLDVGFALENQTRPTYPSTPAETIVVHELAHQWFGDSVSVARWRDIWLNEGFATYLQLRYTEAHGGYTTARNLKRYYAYYKGYRAFWRLSLTNPGPNRIFDAAIYDRGAMTLAALRKVIGKKDFRRLLRTWASTHEDGNVRAPQFERLAERVSGEQLDDFFRAWLRADHRPPQTAAYGL